VHFHQGTVLQAKDNNIVIMLTCLLSQRQWQYMIHHALT
jgi:hypothetical protein